MLILGIDPGTATLGYGIIKKLKRRKKYSPKYRCLCFGCIETEKDLPFPKRLLLLSKEMRKIVKKYQPDIVAMETLFFFQNKKTAIQVSQATGAIILTLERLKLPIREFTPQEVKKALTKNGRANKKDIEKKVRRILRIKKPIYPDDAADALAIAVCAAKKIKV